MGPVSTAAQLLAAQLTPGGVRYDNPAAIQRAAGELATALGGDGAVTEAMPRGDAALYLVALLAALHD